MSNVPAELKYSKEHEWLRKEADGSYTVGITEPVGGEIVAVNDALSDSPELVNSEPYAGGWIFKIKASDESEIESLLDATAYEALLEDE